MNPIKKQPVPLSLLGVTFDKRPAPLDAAAREDIAANYRLHLSGYCAAFHDGQCDCNGPDLLAALLAALSTGEARR